MRNGTPPIASIERALRVLDRVVADAGEHNITELAVATGVPVASLHRIVASLVRSEYLTSASRGRYVAGPALIATAYEAQSSRALIAFARPKLRELARRTKHIAHLGIFENDMVTYLIKIGNHGDRLFTREGMQLEAYCSSIGKVLLSYLGDSDRERYLSGGPFIALTDNTQTDPIVLRKALERVVRDGFALDDREIAADLICVAVPVRWPDGRARAAISLSTFAGPQSVPDLNLVPSLQATANTIEQCLHGKGGGHA